MGPPSSPEAESPESSGVTDDSEVLPEQPADVHKDDAELSATESVPEQVAKVAAPEPESPNLSDSDEAPTLHLTQEVKAAREAAKLSDESPWPAGPAEFKELFAWPARYANKILNDDEYLSTIAQQNLCCNIVHHEAFAGTGGAGVALHMVHAALRHVLLERQPPGQPLVNLFVKCFCQVTVTVTRSSPTVRCRQSPLAT